MRIATLRAYSAAAAGVSRQPGLPTLLPAGLGRPEIFANLQGLAEDLARRAGGRDLDFTPRFVGYPGFDTFPALAVDAIAGDVRDYLGTVAIQGRSAEELVAAFPIARAA